MDWEGTAAADDAHKNLSDYLRDKNLIRENEFLVAVSLFNSDGFTSIHAFVFEGKEFEEVQEGLSAVTDPIPVRKVEVKLKTPELLEFFQRLHVVLTGHGLQLEGREYFSPE